ncbi:MAG: nucleotidyltransferase domain-containing protein [Myxococcaceae bacterium]|nr:nucleotidyltransferase domain-containing protein [Myxococcaceae bacterium]MCI0669568.1 nucleotidyltransferase domain-containing protein [Myxococcaceae bacterium]
MGLARTLPLDVSGALDALSGYLRARFAGRLARLVLFGSYARGEAIPLESDVDVLVVVDELTQQEHREVVSRAAEISCLHNVLLTPLVLPAARFDQMRRWQLLLAQNIEREGSPL